MFSHMALPVPAREVKVAVTSTVPLKVPLYIRIDRVGQVIPGLGKVIFTRPSPPCFITPATRVYFVRECRHRVRELERNYLVTLYYPDTGTRLYYIYPKSVWDTVYSRYLERMIRGDPPAEPGLLLYGPKGTGKTSMINLLADVLGVYKVKIDTRILSKYVGESEHRLLNKLREAEVNEPSLVDMDEQDYLVRRRDTVRGDDATGQTLGMLLSVFLTEMPRLKREGKRILIVLATNLSPSLIDDALLRHERFGKPVFVPLPDYEAIHTYMRLRGVHKVFGVKETEKIASQLSAVGVTMADLVDIVDEMLEKKIVPDLGKLTKYERGYKRPFPAAIEEGISDLADALRLYTRGKSRLNIFAKRIHVAEALLVTALVLLKTPVVVLTDQRYFDEALATAEASDAVLIVPSDYIHDDVQRHLYLNAKCPVWFVGSRMVVDAPSFNLDTYMTHARNKHAVVKAICNYYNIKYDEKTVREVVLDSSKRDKFLREIGHVHASTLSEIVT